MPGIQQSLTMGIKQVMNDASSVQYNKNANLTLNFKTYDSYKLLKTWIRIKGTIKASIETESSVQKDFEIIYKSDYTYRLLSNFLFKLNSNIDVKQLSDLSYCKYFSILENIGRLPLENIPTQMTIQPQEKEAYEDFEILIPLWFIMPDMINQTQTFIFTQLYSSITATFKAEDINYIIKEITDPDVKIDIHNANIDSVSNYWIMPGDYLSGSRDEIIAKMGSLSKVNTRQENITGGGQNLYIRLMPTTQMIMKGLTIVCRTESGQRVDNLITRFEVKNGDRPLINVSPEIIRQEMVDRYNLDWKMFEECDDTQKDRQGMLFGVYKIDSSYFGDLENSLLATGNWNQPFLFFDVDQAAFEKIGERVFIWVFQESVEVPSVFQQLANGYVREVRG